MTDSAQVNFRTRTGQARRARTRAKILSAVFTVFDERPAGQITVEDVREAAGLARGSFYNYFETCEDMLKELAAEIARQINVEQSARFDDVAHMAERLWGNVRYFLMRAASDRSCSEILARVTPLVGALNENMRQHAARNLSISVERNIIDVPSMGVALDLSYGLVAMMLRRASNFGIDAREIEAAGLMLLRAFGLPETEARRISRLPLPLLPDLPLRTAVIENFGAR